MQPALATEARSFASLTMGGLSIRWSAIRAQAAVRRRADRSALARRGSVVSNGVLVRRRESLSGLFRLRTLECPSLRRQAVERQVRGGVTASAMNGIPIAREDLAETGRRWLRAGEGLVRRSRDRSGATRSGDPPVPTRTCNEMAMKCSGVCGMTAPQRGHHLRMRERHTSVIRFLRYFS